LPAVTTARKVRANSVSKGSSFDQIDIFDTKHRLSLFFNFMSGAYDGRHE
jgi:hypothetical protein